MRWNIFLVVAIAGMGIYRMFPSQPNNTTTTFVGRVDPNIDPICSALYALRAMAPPNYPQHAPTPFELLSLDTSAEPFSPPERSAHQGMPSHAHALRLVADAEARLRARLWPAYRRGEPGPKATVEALWVVGHMLQNDRARTLFLLQFQPHLGGPVKQSWWDVVYGKVTAAAVAEVRRTRFIEERCRASWHVHGWTVDMEDEDKDKGRVKARHVNV